MTLDAGQSAKYQATLEDVEWHKIAQPYIQQQRPGIYAFCEWVRVGHLPNPVYARYLLYYAEDWNLAGTLRLWPTGRATVAVAPGRRGQGNRYRAL